MKKFNKVYEEAKVSMREKIGKKDSLTELPDYRQKTRSLNEIKTSLKEIVTRLQKQSKDHQTLINDNTSLADFFTDSGNMLMQETDGLAPSSAIIGPTFTILGDMHNQLEVSRSRLDISINNSLVTPWQDFMKNELRDSMVVRARYDKYRVTFDAASESYKALRRKPNVSTEKLQESEQDLHLATQEFSDVAVESLYALEDVIDKNTIDSVDHVYDYVKAYQDYFQKGLDIIKEVMPNIERQKQSTAKLRQSIVEKKKKRGDDLSFNSSPSAERIAQFEVDASNIKPINNNNQINNNLNNSNNNIKKLLFGNSLEMMGTRDGVLIPKIVTNAIAYMMDDKVADVEGIFRVSANQRELNEIKTAVNNGSMTSFDQVDDPHLVTNFIKSFLRELPTPLLTYELFTPLCSCVMDAGAEDVESTITKIKGILTTLPAANLQIFKMLLKLLAKIAQHSKLNRMTTSNLSIVLSPNILYPLKLDMASINNSNSTMDFMIKNYNKLFDDDQIIIEFQPPTKPQPTQPIQPIHSHSNHHANRKSVIPPSLPTKPSNLSFNNNPLYNNSNNNSNNINNNINNKRLSNSSSKIQVNNNNEQHLNNNNGNGAPILPPKRLSNSTSQIPPPTPQLSSPDSAQQQSQSTPSSPPMVRANGGGGGKQISNRMSMLITNYNQTPPPLPNKPNPRSSVYFTNPVSPSLSNSSSDIPPPLSPIDNYRGTNSTPSSPQLSPHSSLLPPTPPNQLKGGSMRSKPRPQAIKFQPGATLTSGDIKTTHNLLDDSFTFESTLSNQHVDDTEDLINWE